MSSRIIHDVIGGVRVVRRVQGNIMGSAQDGPSSRPHTRQRPNDLVTAKFEEGGIAVKGPDGAFLLGNRGGPVTVPATTALTSPSYPILQVHWHDRQARPGLLTFGEQLPAYPTASTAPWGPLFAHLEWSQGSNSKFSADVDVKLGTSFPITFSSLSCSVEKDYHIGSPSADIAVSAQAGIAPLGYGGFGSPTRTILATSAEVAPFTATINVPPFSRRVNISWDEPATVSLTVEFLIGGYGYAVKSTEVILPMNSGPVPPIVLPNNCYALLVTATAASTEVQTVFDLDIR